jgi:type I restriction enzyme S subunit
MAIAGTVGKVAIIPEGLGTCNLTENLALLSPKDSVDPKYLFCLLSSSIVQIQIQKEMSELRQQKLGLAKVRNLKIPKPPEKKEDQLQIVDRVMAEINHMRKQKNEITDLLHLAVKEKVEPRLMADIP